MFTEGLAYSKVAHDSQKVGNFDLDELNKHKNLIFLNSFKQYFVFALPMFCLVFAYKSY